MTSGKVLMTSEKDLMTTVKVLLTAGKDRTWDSLWEHLRVRDFIIMINRLCLDWL